MLRIAALLLGATLANMAYAQSAEAPSAKEVIISQQMHGYLDALVEMQLKLTEARAAATKREADWAEYSKPLWANQEHASQ